MMGAPMDVDSDFKSQFYILEGIHIDERKKNFYKLLKSTSTNLPDEQINIQPRNYQENIFYVDVLIHFKKVDKLTDILVGGNGVLASKVLKQKWYFQEAFKNMSDGDIVNKFLPALSKSLRMKVLKKLSLTLDEERMDNIFDLILGRYGLFIAKQFLFSCSPKKIIHVLKNNEIVLTAEQLKRLLKKDINLVKVYIEEYKKNTRKDFCDYDFLNYLTWKLPHLYFEFGLNNQSVIKLGRYTSKAILKTNEEDVLKDVKNCHLNKTTLTRKVKDFDTEYLYLFFPADMKHINSDTYSSKVPSLLSKYPVKKRYEVFSQAFKQAYNKEVTEHLDEFEETFAKLFPTEIQQRWAEFKYLQSNNLMYIKYYDPKKAFALLKDKINVTSDIRMRNQLLNELITNCYRNKDYSTYEHALKYFCVRHRNDDKSLRSNMISYIKTNIDYSLITEVHWKYINEIIDIQRVRGEDLPFEVITEYLLFLYSKELPLDEAVVQFTKDCLKGSMSFRLRRLVPEAESSILKRIVKILPTLQLEDRESIAYLILYNIIDFNKEIKNDKIFNKEFTKNSINLNDCPIIMDYIKEVYAKQDYTGRYYEVVATIIRYNSLYSEVPLKDINEESLLNIVTTKSKKDDGYSLSSSILEVIKKPKRNNFESTLLDHFFRTYDDYFYLQDAVKYFITREPQVIAKYFEQILHIETMSYDNTLDYDIIKQYSHLGLTEKVIDYFKALVSVDSKSDKKAKLLNCLSKVMTTKDFIDLVKDYTPETKKLDLNDEAQKDIYQVQCDVSKAFKNLNDVSMLAPVLMHYCQGDYLQSSLAALYRVLYRLNEENAAYYISVLGSRSMSTRKHAVFLALEVLSLKEAMAIYLELSNKESNISAKKYLLDAVLKHFIKNPLESVLDIVFLNMHFVDKNDTEMIQTLVDSVSKILNKYKPIFIEKVWKFLDVLERQEVKVTDFRNKILLLINNYETSFMLKLNGGFCEDTIKRYFLSSDDSLQNQLHYIDGFVINYLLAYSDESHFQFVFNIIKNYKDKHWESNNEGSRPFILRLFSTAYRNFDKNDAKFLNLFTSSWQHLFSHIDSFTQYSLLRLMSLYKEDTNIETFSKKVDKFLQELMAEYGPYIGDLLIDSIKTFFNNIPSKDNTDFNLGNFTYHLLKSNSSEFNCYLTFNIVESFYSREQKEIYSKIVNILKGVTNSTAKIYCNVLLKKFN